MRWWDLDSSWQTQTHPIWMRACEQPWHVRARAGSLHREGDRPGSPRLDRTREFPGSRRQIRSAPPEDLSPRALVTTSPGAPWRRQQCPRPRLTTTPMPFTQPNRNKLSNSLPRRQALSHQGSCAAMMTMRWSTPLWKPLGILHPSAFGEVQRWLASVAHRPPELPKR